MPRSPASPWAAMVRFHVAALQVLAQKDLLLKAPVLVLGGFNSRKASKTTIVWGPCFQTHPERLPTGDETTWC